MGSLNNINTAAALPSLESMPHWTKRIRLSSGSGRPATSANHRSFLSRSIPLSTIFARTRDLLKYYATWACRRERLSAGNGADGEKRFRSGRDLLRQWGVRRLQGQIFLAREEKQ